MKGFATVLAAILAASGGPQGAQEAGGGGNALTSLPAVVYPPIAPTRVGFAGTHLAPGARGSASVWGGRSGVFHIDARFDRLDPATAYTPGFMTYVLWAVSPDGAASNLGELKLRGHRARLRTSTPMPAFGLMVTAEPSFAAREPSAAVVLENVIRPDTLGRILQIRPGPSAAGDSAAVGRPQDFGGGTSSPYGSVGRPQDFGGGTSSPYGSVGRREPPLQARSPDELSQARGALWAAYRAGAAERAPESYQRASHLLYEAEDRAEEGDRPGMIMAARQAASGFEESRLEARSARAEERVLARERQAEWRLLLAKADAEREGRLRAEAEAARRFEAEAREATRDAVAARQEAEREKAALRARLLDQFNRVLSARDTARGLILSMPDVLFETGRSGLSPAAREQLAKVAGIVQAHPGLRLEVEGHADSVGAEVFNQRLSGARAEAVRARLAEQGVPPEALSARSFGETRPLDTNETEDGRRRNRRVEIVVSGGPID